MQILKTFHRRKREKVKKERKKERKKGEKRKKGPINSLLPWQQYSEVHLE